MGEIKSDFIYFHDMKIITKKITEENSLPLGILFESFFTYFSDFSYATKKIQLYSQDDVDLSNSLICIQDPITEDDLGIRITSDSTFQISF